MIEELLDLVEMEVRELLDEYDFPGDDTPIIRGFRIEGIWKIRRRPWGRQMHSGIDGCSRQLTFRTPVRDNGQAVPDAGRRRILHHRPWYGSDRPSRERQY